MSSTFSPAETLRQHRPLLLGMEAIGWFHMAGKARAEFLRQHGGEHNGYNERQWHQQETPPFPWDGLLEWVRRLYGAGIPNNAWPDTFAAFTEQHAGRSPGLLGLLQAGHGIASGIEKNLPNATSEYLKQAIPHMWLSSPWGHPKGNLLADPPEILTPQGWRQLVAEIRRILEELRDLGTQGGQDVALWRRWREGAIGEGSFIRRAFLSTLAETRLPNNDVTLWDQSYVAAALFKSAVAGALLNPSSRLTYQDIENHLQQIVANWNQIKKEERQQLINSYVKNKTRWRLLTIAIGTEHYEARSVKIGDWTGAQGAIGEFFRRVAELVEVDLAVGALIYQDDSVAVFSFPGERFDKSTPAAWLNGWENWLQEQAEVIARDLNLETPPYVALSVPTRSLVPMAQEWRKARETVAVPIYRKWDVHWLMPSEARGHVCPVCRVRLNGDRTNKGKPCEVCWNRRHHRRDDWLQGQLGNDTIWFEEVADRNDRLALLTFALDLEEWLSGNRVDSLRAQAIPEWARFNPVLEEFWERDESKRQKMANPISPTSLFGHLVAEIQKRFKPSGIWHFPAKKGKTDKGKTDLLLANLQEGFRHLPILNPKKQDESQTAYEERLWRTFFQQIVEDRAEAPLWTADDQRADWLAHQLFRKLPSPGRVYRFWREAEEFFRDLLREFRQIAARSENTWRIRRLFLQLDHNASGQWKDEEVYNANLRGAPFSLLYLGSLQGFLTISNLGRVLEPHEEANALKDKTLELRQEDDERPSTLRTKTVTARIEKVEKIPRSHAHLAVYHPLIPIEISPFRFRVVVPLEAASACVDLAVSRWQEQFARVWDRLPLRVGVIGFPRLVPYQAVVEAVRNMEEALSTHEEMWRVEEVQKRAGVVALRLRRRDRRSTLRVVPVALPDGREDVFYPYVAVEDQALRFPRDFRHPDNERIFRHVTDLCAGDGIRVVPAKIATLFMDSTAARFGPLDPQYLEEWTQMRETWELLQRVAPSQTAVQRLCSELARLDREWRTPEGGQEAAEDLWKDTLRALLVHHLEVQGAALDALTEGAVQGTLQWALDWHMTALKESV